MLKTWSLLALTLALVATACGDDDGGSDAASDAMLLDSGEDPDPLGGGPITNVMETAGDGAPIAPATECTITTSVQANTTATHLDPCSELALPHVPPASGPHFRVWANFVEYSQPVPWGFLIHSLEHGAVVLGYKCDGECDDIVSALQRVKAGVTDEMCDNVDGVDNRVIIVPMPDIETPIVALAWEQRYEATCIDMVGLQAFVDANYANAPENFCNPGQDLESEGWCL